jgi:transposase
MDNVIQMASIDKQSVRDEFEKAKAKFKMLADEGKISSEAVVLFNSFIMLLNIVLSIFLEKTTKKTSANSSIPPSQTEKDESFTIDKKSNGKGKRETITMAGNTRTVETITTVPVEACHKCGKDLKKVKRHCVERRTRIDIIFEKTVEHVDAEVKQCPSCQTTIKGSFPQGMDGRLQYGDGIKAFVIQLLVMQMMTLNRVSKMMASFVGKMISEATLLNYIMRLHIALEEWETNTKQQILTEKCIHVDETSLRVDKKNNWVHVCSTGDIVLKFLHKNRGKAAIEDIDIIPKYKGVIVHDCWASYFAYKNCAHGLCGSHILRELTFIVDAHGYRWAKNMKRLLKRACKVVSNKRVKCLNEKDFERLLKCYQSILAKGKEELPIIPKKPDGRRGRIAKSDAHNLWERLEKHEASVLLFAKLSYVPFTNNRAEQDLRMSKVKQKVSGCFRTEKYARAYCRISSYLQTMKNKGINPIVAVSMALSGNVSL